MLSKFAAVTPEKALMVAGHDGAMLSRKEFDSTVSACLSAAAAWVALAAQSTARNRRDGLRKRDIVPTRAALRSHRARNANNERDDDCATLFPTPPFCSKLSVAGDGAAHDLLDRRRRRIRVDIAVPRVLPPRRLGAHRNAVFVPVKDRKDATVARVRPVRGCVVMDPPPGTRAPPLATCPALPMCTDTRPAPIVPMSVAQCAARRGTCARSRSVLGSVRARPRRARLRACEL